ncbi:MAG: 3-deoxy-manno-octulosonate cytidylyltransferase [Gemmataceae bacterium]|nr:3-deoxy-manno-octulosonate cytidylyltransferase [Gemmataceae bacterium]MDW8264161.1 3-deoxy-manno-octulosonate cytidylyltransferase [Gemmataceae bacterium]
MQVAIVIPARYASKRLPGKPLLRVTGKYLIQHVYERACQAHRARTVIVATDDPRIAAAVRRFGGRVAMTRRDHPSGTDRVAEVARHLDADVVINLQGDEPLIDPEALDLLPGLLERDPEADMATLAVPLRSKGDWLDPNCVKVVCDATGRALYFSRSPIPYVRDGEPDFASDPPRFLRHLGLYAYRREFLLQLAMLPPAPLEKLEKLEQLRVLARGRAIQVGVVRHGGLGVDTAADYERFVQLYRRSRRRPAA